MSDDLIKEFLIESSENLDRLDVDLVALELDPHDGERLASIFRTFHTIKGTCGFLAFNRLETVSHAGEGLLSALRDGSVTFNREIATALLRLVDTIRRILAHIEATGAEPAGEDGGLIAELSRLRDHGPPSPAAELEIGIPKTVELRSDIDRRSGADRRASGGNAVSGIADASLRVAVGTLDRLMDLVGELVLARNQIVQRSAASADLSLASAAQRLNLVTAELQEGVMKTRLQPIGKVWSKLPRMVRDLTTQLGKHVRLEMEGQDTELDKALVEAIKDPLTHIVRNAIDHGIETPAVRALAGKPVEGRLRLAARHEGGQIAIEISDDGAGIDPQRVRETAIRTGLVPLDAAAALSDQGALQLVFRPGFSTAEQVTSLSGRGVGMDVVKTNIERIGGQIDIRSRAGEGTTLRVRIPLTLAIVPALIVADRGGERYAIPQAGLRELVRLEADEARGAIEWIRRVPFLRLRDSLLPLLYLERELGLGDVEPHAAAAANIAVLKADDREFGLVVDAILDTEEIVVKPLGRQLHGVTVFAGATIMGDGRVALILDVMGLARQANVVRDGRDERRAEMVVSHAGTAPDERQALLLFRAGRHECLAIPLTSVARLEEFPASRIERSGTRQVVQYRGHVLPLVAFDASAPYVGKEGQPRQVIVCSENRRTVGLLVDQIIDVVSERVDLPGSLARPGVLGSAVIQERVTDLIDVQAVFTALDCSEGAAS